MSAEIMARVQKTFSSVFGQRVPFGAELRRVDEPRWTSLKHVELIIALEQEFGVRFDGADATDMISFPIVTERIRQRVK